MKFQLFIVLALAIFAAVCAYRSDESNDLSNDASNDLSNDWSDERFGRPPYAVPATLPPPVQKEVVEAETEADNLEIMYEDVAEVTDVPAEEVAENATETREARCKKGKGKKKYGKKWGK